MVIPGGARSGEGPVVSDRRPNPERLSSTADTNRYTSESSRAIVRTSPEFMSEDTPPPEPAPKPKSKLRRRLFIVSQVVLGLALGLGIAEYAFSKRADGAFPHVNFYVEDPELGVRLEPGASMRFALHDNPVSTIHVNSQGFRGADWPEPDPRDNSEILVIGDSQVFGLGVEDGQTFSARLAEHTGRVVLNAGVPTYGPPEYAALAEEIIDERRPETLIYVLNFLNDPFELERPNAERHAVWDGWAVRAETAPAPGSITQFPGRRWLYSKSQLVYAARRWWHERDTKAEDGAPKVVDLGVPSEGNWRDLVADGTESLEHVAAREQRARNSAERRRARLVGVERSLHTTGREIDDLIADEFYEWREFDRAAFRGRPGDIVEDDYSESSRSVLLTAAHIREAARARDRHLKDLLHKQKRAGKTGAADLIADAEELEQEREDLRRQIAAGDILGPQQPLIERRRALRRVAADGGEVDTGRHPSVFDAHLEALATMCALRGVNLVVVALPVDVQVSADEWAKYGVEDAPDMEPSLALLDDLSASAEAQGARTLDATEALRAASPGAFLNGDIHMTPKGHAALAEALAVVLDNPPALILPAAGLPEGVLFPPARSQWRADDEVNVKGSTKAGCSTQIRNGWLRVRCVKARRRSPGLTGLELSRGPAAALALVSAHGASLVTPLSPGEDIVARFDWETRSRELRITWPIGDDGEPHFLGQFVDLEGPGQDPGEGPKPKDEALAARVQTLCACHAELTDEQHCIQQGDDYDSWVEDCEPSCRELWARPDQACFDTYATAVAPSGDGPQQYVTAGLDCAALLACVQADPLSPPTCKPGMVHATATNGCFQPCDDLHPCDAGACTAYNGGGICL